MRVLEASAILCVLALPARLGLPSSAFGTDFPLSAVGGDQSAPDLARAGGTFLAVWQDERDALTTKRDVYAARVSGSGAVLDPAGIAVCAAGGPQECPRVASDGTDFIVVWQDDGEEDGVWEVRAARVTAGGGTPDGEGVVVAAGSQKQPRPNVAWAGSHYLVAWQHSTDGTETDVHVARVAADGTVMDDPPVVADAAAGNQDSISLAYGAGKTLLAYRDPAGGTHIKGLFVDSAGDPSATFTIANATGTQRSPAVAFGGGLFLVAWEDHRTGVIPDVYAARVESDGNVLDLGAAAHIALAVTADSNLSPAVTFDGAAFVVAWEDDRNVSTGFDIYCSRVSAAGEVIDPGAPICAGDADQVSVSVAAGSPATFFAWADHRHELTTGADIFGCLAQTNETPVASASFSPATPSEGDTITLDAAASQDPEGAALSYLWTQVSGPDVGTFESTLPAPAFVAPESDAAYDLVFSLEVSDGWSSSDPYPVTVAVDADDDPPVAAAGDVSANECEIVTLDGSASYDPEGEGLTFEWSQDGGPLVALDDPASPTPSFPAPDLTGDYALTFTLTVRDGTQESAVPVTVSVAADDDPPAADAGEQITVQSGTPVTLDGTRSSDPEGGPLAAYSWTQDWGPAVSLSDASSPTPSFTAPDAAGEVVLAFTLTVTDGGGNQDSDQTQVWVGPDEPPAPVGSGFHVENVTHGSADVVWLTDIEAAGRVEYGTTPARGSECDEPPGFGTSHRVQPVDLRAGAKYWYRARSTGTGGAWTVSNVYEFTMLAPPPSEDLDDDGIPDDWEDANGLDSGDPTDALADPDHDGLSNLEEYRHATDRDLADTDSDGCTDGYEVRRGTSPLRSDSVPPPLRPDDDSCGSSTGSAAPVGAALLVALAAFLLGRTAPARMRRESRP